MKVAVISESPADAAAIRILVDAILGTPTEPSSTPTFQARPGGWDAIWRDVPMILRHLYFKTDADALIIVGDSDNSVIHESSAQSGLQPHPDSRLIKLQKRISEIERQLPAIDRLPIKVAVGIAVPSIEAWYLCGKDSQASETGWSLKRDQRVNAPTEIRRMKKLVYGTDRPSLTLETERAETQARRLSLDLAPLEQAFPIGFGLLASELRRWLSA